MCDVTIGDQAEPPIFSLLDGDQIAPMADSAGNAPNAFQHENSETLEDQITHGSRLPEKR